MTPAMRVVSILMGLTLLAGTTASGACFCIGCTHEDDAVCSTCDNPRPVKKSCCEKPEKSEHKQC